MSSSNISPSAAAEVPNCVLIMHSGFDSLWLQDHSQHAPQDPQQFFATFFLNMRVDLSFHLISHNQQINGHLSRKIGHGSDDSMNWWNCVPGVGDLQDNVVRLYTCVQSLAIWTLSLLGFLVSHSISLNFINALLLGVFSRDRSC